MTVPNKVHRTLKAQGQYFEHFIICFQNSNLWHWNQQSVNEYLLWTGQQFIFYPSSKTKWPINSNIKHPRTQVYIAFLNFLSKQHTSEVVLCIPETSCIHIWYIYILWLTTSNFQHILTIDVEFILGPMKIITENSTISL